AHGRLGDPVVREDGPLTFRRSPAVTPHRGDDEGTRPERPEVLDGGPRDHVDVDDAAAPHGEGDGLTRSDGEGDGGERRARGPGDIGQGRPGELLLDADHPGEPIGAGNARERHGSRPLRQSYSDRGAASTAKTARRGAVNGSPPRRTR